MKAAFCSPTSAANEAANFAESSNRKPSLGGTGTQMGGWFPDAVIEALQTAAALELERAAAADQGSAAVIESWRAAKALLVPYGEQVDAKALQVRMKV